MPGGSSLVKINLVSRPWWNTLVKSATQETEAGEWSLWGQPWLHDYFKATLLHSYETRHCLNGGQLGQKDEA